MPAAAFLSAMPSPDTPLAKRPWTPQCQLGEAGFQSECRAWDINEAVFQGATWTMYQPLLRAGGTGTAQLMVCPQPAPAGAWM